jgi:methionyl-tRNA formyltransferase
MRVVFMGSADIACPSLESLLREPDIEVVGVITQPDRPKGRRLKLSACAVKAHLASSDIAVLTPESINTPESLAALRAMEPDLVVVMAYGQILKPEVLAIPRLGCINVHTSLLPLYRGAAPIQWAVANGDTETGVTIMHMDAGMDTGDIVLQRSVPIGEAETAGDVHDNLAIAGAALLCEAVRSILAGTDLRAVQDEDLATYAAKLKKADGRIDWTQSAKAIYDRIRGFNPWPCCYCCVEGLHAHTLRVLMARMEPGAGVAGEVLAIKGDGPLVACGEGAIRLVSVQPQGKRVMEGCAYLCGHSIHQGDVLS